jgi:hypothetical protein
LPTHCPSEHPGKAGQHAVGHSGQHAVGQAGHGILFVQHQRHAPQRSHHAARKADVAAHAQHHVGPDALELRPGLAEAAQQVEGQQQLAQQSLAAQREKRTQAIS